MDPLMIYCNAIWQDAQRPRRRPERPDTVTEITALARRLERTLRLIWASMAKEWAARRGAA